MALAGGHFSSHWMNSCVRIRCFFDILDEASTLQSCTKKSESRTLRSYVGMTNRTYCTFTRETNFRTLTTPNSCSTFRNFTFWLKIFSLLTHKKREETCRTTTVFLLSHSHKRKKIFLSKDNYYDATNPGNVENGPCPSSLLFDGSQGGSKGRCRRNSVEADQEETIGRGRGRKRSAEARRPIDH